MLESSSSSVVHQCHHRTVQVVQPASSSFLFRPLECRSTSSWISLIFIFSKSRFISLPSSAPVLVHKRSAYFSYCSRDVLNFKARLAGCAAALRPPILMSMAIVERALGGSSARKLRAVLPERALNGEKWALTAVMYLVSMLEVDFCSEQQCLTWKVDTCRSAPLSVALRWAWSTLRPALRFRMCTWTHFD